jgi:hypothetical protein
MVVLHSDLEMFQDQVFLHQEELGFSPNQSMNQWLFQNKNEPLIRLSDLKKNL